MWGRGRRRGTGAGTMVRGLDHRMVSHAGHGPAHPLPSLPTDMLPTRARRGPSHANLPSKNPTAEDVDRNRRAQQLQDEMEQAAAMPKAKAGGLQVGGSGTAPKLPKGVVWMGDLQLLAGRGVAGVDAPRVGYCSKSVPAGIRVFGSRDSQAGSSAEADADAGMEWAAPNPGSAAKDFVTDRLGAHYAGYSSLRSPLSGFLLPWTQLPHVHAVLWPALETASYSPGTAPPPDPPLHCPDLPVHHTLVPDHFKERRLIRWAGCRHSGWSGRCVPRPWHHAP